MFIIIALVILILIFGGVYITSKFKTESSISFEQEKDPVSAYVKQCLSSVTKEGLLLLGQQGGYIYLDNYNVDTAVLIPADSNVLPFSGFYLPYWFYQEKNSLLDKSEMPKLDKTSENDNSMQDQLERYIAEKLPDCTNRFLALKKINLIVLEKKPKTSADSSPADSSSTDSSLIDSSSEFLSSVKIIFGDKDTIASIKYPLEIVKKDAVETIEDFSITVPIGMKKVYELANEITEYESKTFFLEKNTQNLLHLYSGLGDNNLPPTFASKVDQCSNIKYWFYPDVETQFKNMLENNVAFFGIENTDSPLKKITKEIEPDKKSRQQEQGILRSFIHKVSDKEYNNMYVDFIYQDDFPLELNLGSKGIIEPKNMEINLLFLSICLMEYHFTYDFSFPLIVSIIDKNSKIDNNPYLFQFPVKVIVKDNLARVRLSDIIEIPKFKQISECIEENKLSGEVTISVNDQIGNPINDALVYFQCGPTSVYNYAENGSIEGKVPFAEKCSMGKTKSGKLITKFPLCIGGSILSVKALNFVEKAEKIQDIRQGDSFEASIKIQKTTKLEVKVQKYFVQSPAFSDAIKPNNPGVVVNDKNEVSQCNIYSEVSPLGKKEQVLIRFTKLDEENGLINPLPFTTYNPENQSFISLAPGEYTANLILMRQEAYPGEMTIRKDSESKHIPGTLVSSGKTIYYPDKDIKISSTFTGGSLFNITITEKDLANNKLLLTVFDESVPKIVEQVGSALNHREKCYELNKAKAEARFSK